MVWEAQVQVPVGAHPPATFEDAINENFPHDHVISRGEDGLPVSYAGDFIWDWTQYTARKTPSFLRFHYWVTHSTYGRDPNLDLNPERVMRIRELQHFMLLLVYCSNKIFGYRSLHIKLWSLWRLARYAEANDCSLHAVLAEKKLLDAFLISVPDYEIYRIIAWINFLRGMHLGGHLNFRLAEPNGWKTLLKRALEYRRNVRQHAPLPTRVYSDFIQALSDELDDIELHKDKLIGALAEAIERHKVWREVNPTRSVVVGPALIKEFDLEGFLSKRGLPHNLDGLNIAVRDIFSLCKLQIHTFTGMRDEEAKHLPYHCMESIQGRHGKSHALVRGITTKLTGSRCHVARWVTTEGDGFRAIRLAQNFASVIYGACGVVPSDSDENRDNYPLFPSSQYLPWSWNRPLHIGFAPAKLEMTSLSPYLMKKLRPVIEDGDLAELDAVDPFRDWRGDAKFMIGHPWPLTTHQLRRSLALYANASGLVRLSSLRRQLHHVTREMSQYYGRGCAFATDFIAENPSLYKKHICRDWQDAEIEAKYLAFVRDVINCNEPLYGPAGIFFERQKQRGEVMHDKELRKQIELGRLSYKEHPLGGCTNPGSCEKGKGLSLFGTVCATDACRYLIGKHSNVLRLIPLQRKMLCALDPDSITYQMEVEEMKALETIEMAWRPAS